MSLYQNAIDSIQVGVEDFRTGTQQRNISAVRNIIAGILLLYKEKLCRLSPDDHPELLIKEGAKRSVDEDGIVVYLPPDKPHKNTVNISSIKQRFKDFDVDVDWNRFDNAVLLRKDIEHYFTEESQDSITEIIASSFVLINEFVRNHLEEDPHEVFGQEVWETLLEAKDVFEAEKNICMESLAQAEWKYGIVEENLEHIRCEECGSSLVLYDEEQEEREYPDIILRCRQCDHAFEFSNIVEEFVSKALWYDYYTMMTDSGESPTETCPGCGMETYIIEEDCCISCGYEMEYTECSVCYTNLSIHEQSNNGLCDYHQYQYEKTMAE